LATAGCLEERGFAEDVFVSGKETLLWADTDGDDGGGESAARKRQSVKVFKPLVGMIDHTCCLQANWSAPSAERL
jgi:hypothetical protein